MQIAQFMASAVLALVFVFAGSGKLLDQLRTRRALIDLGTPEPAAPLLARILPVAELATGILLLVPSTRWFGGTLSLSLLAAFLTAMVNAYRKGATADCNCFGRATRSGVGVAALIRNVFLMTLSLVALSGSTTPLGWRTGFPVILAVVSSIAAFLLIRQRINADTPDTPDTVTRGTESPFRWIPEELPRAEN